jgi:hypothetical protein
LLTLLEEGGIVQAAADIKKVAISKGLCHDMNTFFISTFCMCADGFHNFCVITDVILNCELFCFLILEILSVTLFSCSETAILPMLTGAFPPVALKYHTRRCLRHINLCDFFLH